MNSDHQLPYHEAQNIVKAITNTLPRLCDHCVDIINENVESSLAKQIELIKKPPGSRLPVYQAMDGQHSNNPGSNTQGSECHEYKAKSTE